MKNKGNILAAILLIGAVALGSAGLVSNYLTQKKVDEVSVGAFRPSGYVGKLLTRLNSGGSETTFNTTPGTAPDGTSLTTAKIGDFIVLTVNPGAANEEKISASAVSVSGTTATWTIINRGLSYTENTAVTANKKQHAIGETVIISNDDHFTYTQYVDTDSAQTISGLKTLSGGFINNASSTFSSTTILAGPTTISSGSASTFSGLLTTNSGLLSTASSTFSSTLTLAGQTTISNGQASTFAGITTTATSTFQQGALLGYSIDNGSNDLAVVNKSYVDGVAVAGASNANLTTKGIVEEATKAEVSAGTAVGGTGSRLFIPASMATSTSQVATTSVVVTGTDGKIDQSFLASSYSFSTITLTGTSSIASSTIRTYAATTTAHNATSTWNKPATIKYVVIEVVGGGGGGDSVYGDEAGAGGGGGGYCRKIIPAVALGDTETIVAGKGGYADTGGSTSSFGTHCTASGGGSGSNQAGGGGGSGSGGDLNINGNGGVPGGHEFNPGGNGGGSFFGGGATGQTGQGGGSNGGAYGGGGSGARNDSTSGSYSGGSGAPGIVIVTEYYY